MRTLKKFNLITISLLLTVHSTYFAYASDGINFGPTSAGSVSINEALGSSQGLSSPKVEYKSPPSDSPSTPQPPAYEWKPAPETNYKPYTSDSKSLGSSDTPTTPNYNYTDSMMRQWEAQKQAEAAKDAERRAQFEKDKADREAVAFTIYAFFIKFREAVKNYYNQVIKEQKALMKNENSRSLEQAPTLEQATVVLGEFYNEATALENEDGPIAADGLLKESLISQPEMAQIRARLNLKSNLASSEGKQVRQIINLALAAGNEPRNVYSRDAAIISIGIAIGADFAALVGDPEFKKVMSQATTFLDIALGFAPVASSINDAGQIISGLLTGFDYTGHPMKGIDYALRGLGIALGIIPAGGAAIRLGKYILDKDFINIAQWIRRTGNGFGQFITDFIRIIDNQFGTLGTGMQKVRLAYENFPGDPQRIKHFLAGANTAYNDRFTIAGRALAKHPGAAGFENYDVMRKVLRTEAEINAVAEATLINMLKKAEPTLVHSPTLNKFVLEYRIPGGHAARFHPDTGQMVGFANP